MQATLRSVAHVRSGDKGDTACISMIAYSPELYDLIREQLTAERLRAFYTSWCRWCAFDLGGVGDRVEICRFIDHIGEMPVIDPRFAMRKPRHFWFGTNSPKQWPMLPFGPIGPPFTCLGHFDKETGKVDLFYAGPDSAPEEPCFVPRRNSTQEGDNWLLSVVVRRAENRADLVILDARRLSD